MVVPRDRLSITCTFSGTPLAVVPSPSFVYLNVRLRIQDLDRDVFLFGRYCEAVSDGARAWSTMSKRVPAIMALMETRS